MFTLEVASKHEVITELNFAVLKSAREVAAICKADPAFAGCRFKITDIQTGDIRNVWYAPSE